MRCCVPGCQNETSISKSEGISFHAFPKEPSTRSAWQKVVSDEVPEQPTGRIVVCSAHFLCSDVYTTRGGIRRVRSGAVPHSSQELKSIDVEDTSITNVCRICLCTEGKMFSMNKYHLSNTFEEISGISLQDNITLPQKLCVECAQKLVNCGKLKEKSIKTNTILTELAMKHETLTLQLLKTIDRNTNNLKSSYYTKIFEPDHYDYLVRGDKLSDVDFTDVEVKNESDNEVYDNDNDNGDFIQEESLRDEGQCNESNFDVTTYEDEATFEKVSHLEDILVAPDRDVASAENVVQDPLTVRQEDNISLPAITEKETETDSYEVTIQEDKSIKKYNIDLKMQPVVVLERIELKYDDENTEIYIDDGAIPPMTLDETEENGNSNSNADSTVAVAPPPKKLKLTLDKANKSKERTEGPHAEQVRETAGDVQEVASTHENKGEKNQIEAKTERINKLHCNVTNKTKIKKTVSSGVHDIKRQHKSKQIHSVTVPRTIRKTILHNDANGGKTSAETAHPKPNEQEPNSIRNSIQNIIRYPVKSVKAITTSNKTCYFACDSCTFVTSLKDKLIEHLKVHENCLCDKCNLTFNNVIDLKKHLLVHAGELFSCNICSKTYRSKARLNAHLNTHTGVGLFLCDVCKKTFITKTDLKVHLRIHTGEKPYNCKVCNKRFAHFSSCQKHLRSHTGEKPYNCEQCDKSFTFKGDLKSHLRIHTGEKPYSCKMCDERFRDPKSLKSHVNNHSNGEKPKLDIYYNYFACDLCSFVTSLKDKLIEHLKSHEICKCKQCNSTFNNVADLKTHLLVHEGKLYSCSECGKNYSNKDSFNAHLKTHTGIGLFVCKICKKTFGSKSNFKQHLQTHTGEKYYTCEICGMKLAYLSSLKKHVSRHAGGRSYECEICHKRFTANSTLKNHLRIHTGEKPYSCEICGRRFAYTNALKKHLKSHIGEKLSSCEICGKRFTSKIYLKSHLRIHTGEKPYECETCDKKFRCKYLLKSHRSRNHSVE